MIVNHVSTNIKREMCQPLYIVPKQKKIHYILRYIVYSVGGGEPPQPLAVEKEKPEVPDIMALFENHSDSSIISETRKKVNKYISNPEKMQIILPHLSVIQMFGRPKHYIKNNR